jgi:hypothetical protein
MHIIQSNTDGIFLLMHKDLYPKFQEICKTWEKTTKLILEEDRFERFYQFAINDYIGVLATLQINCSSTDKLKINDRFTSPIYISGGADPVIQASSGESFIHTWNYFN